MSEPECKATLNGKHMFTPKKIGNNWAKASRSETILINEYQCRCGAWPASEDEVRRQLAKTAAERRRQLEASRRLTGGKRMEKNEAQRLPGFE